MQSVIIKIEAGKITANRTALAKMLQCSKDGRHEVIIKRIGKRSNNQNRYYWGVVVAMIKDRLIELGNDVNSMNVHDFLKDRFNSKEIFTSNGTVIGTVGDTTASISTTDFMNYLDKCKEFAATVLEIYIPDPNEQSELFK